MNSFAHIINVVSELENKSFFEIQKVTLASFVRAKNHSSSHQIEQLLCYHKDFPVKTETNFKLVSPLEKSILDIGNLNNKKALPLLKDILQTSINYASMLKPKEKKKK